MVIKDKETELEEKMNDFGLEGIEDFQSQEDEENRISPKTKPSNVISGTVTEISSNQSTKVFQPPKRFIRSLGIKDELIFEYQKSFPSSFLGSHDKEPETKKFQIAIPSGKGTLYEIIGNDTDYVINLLPFTKKNAWDIYVIDTHPNTIWFKLVRNDVNTDIVLKNDNEFPIALLWEGQEGPEYDYPFQVIPKNDEREIRYKYTEFLFKVTKHLYRRIAVLHADNYGRSNRFFYIESYLVDLFKEVKELDPTKQNNLIDFLKSSLESSRPQDHSNQLNTILTIKIVRNYLDSNELLDEEPTIEDIYEFNRLYRAINREEKGDKLNYQGPVGVELIDLLPRDSLYKAGLRPRKDFLICSWKLNKSFVPIENMVNVTPQQTLPVKRSSSIPKKFLINVDPVAEFIPTPVHSSNFKIKILALPIGVFRWHFRMSVTVLRGDKFNPIEVIKVTPGVPKEIEVQVEDLLQFTFLSYEFNFKYWVEAPELPVFISTDETFTLALIHQKSMSDIGADWYILRPFSSNLQKINFSNPDLAQIHELDRENKILPFSLLNLLKVSGEIDQKIEDLNQAFTSWTESKIYYSEKLNGLAEELEEAEHYHGKDSQIYKDLETKVKDTQAKLAFSIEHLGHINLNIKFNKNRKEKLKKIIQEYNNLRITPKGVSIPLHNYNNPSKDMNFFLRITDTLRRNISVLNLLKNNKFYIENYNLSLLKTSYAEFIRIVSHAGNRKFLPLPKNSILRLASPSRYQKIRNDFLLKPSKGSLNLLKANENNDLEFYCYYFFLNYQIPPGLLLKDIMPDYVADYFNKNIGKAPPYFINIYNDKKQSAKILSDFDPSTQFMMCLWKPDIAFEKRINPSTMVEIEFGIVNPDIKNDIYKDLGIIFHQNIEVADQSGTTVNHMNKNFYAFNEEFKFKVSLTSSNYFTLAWSEEQDVISVEDQDEFLILQGLTKYLIKVYVKNTNSFGLKLYLESKISPEVGGLEPEHMDCDPNKSIEFEMIPIFDNLYINKTDNFVQKRKRSTTDPNTHNNPSLLQPKYPNKVKPTKPPFKPKPPNNPSLLQPLESKK